MKNLLLFLISSIAFGSALGSLMAGAVVSFGLGFLIPSKVGVAYMAIPLQDSRAIFTSGVVSRFKDAPQVTSFLRSFFKKKISLTKTISIEVRRGIKKVAVDVGEFQDGNLVANSKSSQSMFSPPNYHEYIVANDSELYDIVIGQIANGDTSMFPQIVAESAERLATVKETIEDAMEVQCAQVFDSGVVQLVNNEAIDYGRLPLSKVAYNASNDFSVATVNPYKVLEVGCKFIREQGKSNSGIFNLILGEQAMSAFLTNDFVVKRNDIKHINLDAISKPQREATGSTFHGEIIVGSYNVRLWSYPASYTDASGNSIPFINEKKVVLLADNPEFVLGYAAVKQLIDSNGTIKQQGEWLVTEVIDKRRQAHEIHLKTRPLAIPVAIDQIWTATVLS